MRGPHGVGGGRRAAQERMAGAVLKKAQDYAKHVDLLSRGPGVSPEGSGAHQLLHVAVAADQDNYGRHRLRPQLSKMGSCVVQ
jgi:hypothetical protein